MSCELHVEIGTQRYIPVPQTRLNQPLVSVSPGFVTHPSGNMPSILQIVGGLVLLGLAHVVGSFVYQIVYYRFFHPLSRFPGPFWGSVTRLWITYHNIKGDEPETFQALHRRYGMPPSTP